VAWHRTDRYANKRPEYEPSWVGCRFLVMKDGDMPKTYDPEFKARAVRLVRDHLADYGSVTAASFAVGAQLGVSRETLRRWVVQAEIDDGARSGVTTAEAEEIRRLKAENKRLREANEILKAASIFFAGELDSRNR
jgi:transposase